MGLGLSSSDAEKNIILPHNDTKPQTQSEWGLCESNCYSEEELDASVHSSQRTDTFGTNKYARNSCLWKNSKQVYKFILPL